ncbi:hypothetical protein BDZ89DRAFT_1074742 [Hymenopellis radicata]|nr:hypothetical protein BDZ89DRAFT_1074742 [Hymenopellis radicata]
MSSESSAGPHGWSPSFPCPINVDRHLQMERYTTPIGDVPTRLHHDDPASSSPEIKEGPDSLRNLAMVYSQSVQAHTYRQMVKVVQKKHSLETIPIAVTVAERSISSTPSKSPTPEVKQEVFDDLPLLVGPGVPGGLLQLPKDFDPRLPTPPPEFFRRPYFFKRTSREVPGIYGYRLPWSLMRKGITARPEDILLHPDVTELGEARTGAIQDRKRLYNSQDDMLPDGAERVHKRHRSKLREEIHPEGESSNHQDNEIDSPALWPVVEDPADSMSQELQLSESVVPQDNMQGTVCAGANWTRLTCTSLSNSQDVVPTSALWDGLGCGLPEPKLHADAGIASEADKENVTISVASLLN